MPTSGTSALPREGPTWESAPVARRGRRSEEPVTEAPLFTELSARRLGPVRRFFVRRPVVMDAIVMLCFTFVGLLEAAGARSMYPIDMLLGRDLAQRMELWGVSLVVVGTVTLVWRRRRPATVAVVMAAAGATALALSGGTAGFEMGLAFALYAVAASRPALVTWWTSALTVGAMLLAALLPLPRQVGVLSLGYGPIDSRAELEKYASTAAPQVWGLMVVALVLPALLCIAVGTSVRNRRLHVADLVDRANALARDRDQHAQLARAAERARIAREMHDVVAHSLTEMIALGDGAASSVRRDPALSRAALDELSTTGRAALADMRRLLGVLHEETPDADDAVVPFEPQPTAPDLAVLVDRFRAAGLPLRATGVGGDALPPDPTLQLAVVRIVEEALTNALQHAHGTLGVDLLVRRVPGAVEVEVVDQGPAVPVEGGQGTPRGLIGMNERAAVYGGTVEAGPHGNGWRVHARLPWDEGTT
ncbi:two-component sensor histidine kinase [Actinotalea ferrariae]|uniref:sensor histidine kinase n=1 Tax=Actinotalea ferrariae TaxID=1386098 RepID=UPI001C8BD22D|nr:sensor histidine kinase [Actinotalea ferrariae]MBX9246137.1 two-component sensor histidine kinase [Actinotalea ferrariae]